MLIARKKLQDAATTGNGNELDLRATDATSLLLTLEPAGTIASGEVTLEEANTPGFAGTWNPLAAAVTLVTTTVKTIRVTGPFAIVRARISVNVTGAGGSITAMVKAETAGD